MTWVVVGVAVALAVVAAAGVLHPFRRSRAVALEAPADPLDDERRSLLRALRELDEDRATGRLSDEDHRALRDETEARAVVVLRSLEARDGAAALARGLREVRSPASGNGSEGAEEKPTRPRLRRRILAGAIVAVLAAAVVVPSLAAAIRSRTPDQPLTGDVPGTSALAFFEDRVRLHPDDLAARLDLAERYLESGDAARASEQYRAALSIDPRNPEALTRVGLILFGNGLATEALASVDLAISSDPGYAEAYFVRGVVLLDGLDRPEEAAAAFRRYLELAPFGSYRAEAERLVQEVTSGSR